MKLRMQTVTMMAVLCTLSAPIGMRSQHMMVGLSLVKTVLQNCYSNTPFKHISLNEAVVSSRQNLGAQITPPDWNCCVVYQQ